MLFRSLLAALSLLCAHGASAQIAHVQSNSAVSNTFWVTGSLDETLSFAGAVTSGNTVVAWTMWAVNSVDMSCTHDGNAMTPISNPDMTASGKVEMFARVATTTGTGVVCTATGNDAAGNHGFCIAEFSGAAGTLSTQGGAGVTATAEAETTGATSHDSGADLTPDTAHNVSVAASRSASNGGTWGDDGFTMILSNSTRRCGYLIQSSATAHDWVPTTSNSVNAATALNNLDGATAGGTTPLRRRRSN